MKVLWWSALLIGMASIFSSWFSIEPASDHRSREYYAKLESNPESVTNDEAIMMKDDQGMTALSLIIVGGIAFLIATLTVPIITEVLFPKRIGIFYYGLGGAWTLLGGMLHLYVWS